MKSNKFYDNLFKKILNETLQSKADDLMEKMTNPTPPPTEFDYVAEGETCECGGVMREGECMECGMREGEVMEKLHGKQSMLDKNKNNKIDSEDFKLLRKSRKKNMEESETDESREFVYAANQAKKQGKKSFELDGKEFPVKESIIKNNIFYKLDYQGETELFTENEIVDIIEKIIKEEKDFRKGQTPAGYVAYEKSHKGSGKEEDQYMKDLTEKMKKYLKDGSKGDFDMNPKFFPKGNGQLAKMKAKKYTMSDDGKEFLDRYMRPGMEDLVPEEIEYDEDWVSDNIEGSTRTGNNPKWANAEETDLGKKINKKRKDKKFHKAKETSYRKAPQPVTDGTGENSGSGLNIKESENKKDKVLSEEFKRMKSLINYNGKTQ